MSVSRKVLCVYSVLPQPMRRDLEALRTQFRVEEFKWDMSRANRFRLFELPVRIFVLIFRIVQSDLLYLRFANSENLFIIRIAKLFRKKVVLLSGGYDAVVMPEINYGLAISPKGRRTVEQVLRMADKVVAFSDSSRQSILELSPAARVVTSYIGSIDTEYFRPCGPKDGSVITIGHIKWNNLKRKGLETFVKAARYLPDIKFSLVGDTSADDSIDYLRQIATGNVDFRGFLSEEEMLRSMQRASVYVQASAHEGFGISLANAMACGCIPVVTDRGALPEVVGDVGIYVPFDDPEELAKGIGRALQCNEDPGKRARRRVIENFNYARRERELLEIVASC